jgi:hypothetical protein
LCSLLKAKISNLESERLSARAQRAALQAPATAISQPGDAGHISPPSLPSNDPASTEASRLLKGVEGQLNGYKEAGTPEPEAPKTGLAGDVGAGFSGHSQGPVAKHGARGVRAPLPPVVPIQARLELPGGGLGPGSGAGLGAGSGAGLGADSGTGLGAGLGAGLGRALMPTLSQEMASWLASGAAPLLTDGASVMATSPSSAAASELDAVIVGRPLGLNLDIAGDSGEAAVQHGEALKAPAGLEGGLEGGLERGLGEAGTEASVLEDIAAAKVSISPTVTLTSLLEAHALDAEREGPVDGIGASGRSSSEARVDVDRASGDEKPEGEESEEDVPIAKFRKTSVSAKDDVQERERKETGSLVSRTEARERHGEAPEEDGSGEEHRANTAEDNQPLLQEEVQMEQGVTKENEDGQLEPKEDGKKFEDERKEQAAVEEPAQTALVAPPMPEQVKEQEVQVKEHEVQVKDQEVQDSVQTESLPGLERVRGNGGEEGVTQEVSLPAIEQGMESLGFSKAPAEPGTVSSEQRPVLEQSVKVGPDVEQRQAHANETAPPPRVSEDGNEDLKAGASLRADTQSQDGLPASPVEGEGRELAGAVRAGGMQEHENEVVHRLEDEAEAAGMREPDRKQAQEAILHQPDAGIAGAAESPALLAPSQGQNAAPLEDMKRVLERVPAEVVRRGGSVSREGGAAGPVERSPEEESSDPEQKLRQGVQLEPAAVERGEPDRTVVGGADEFLGTPVEEKDREVQGEGVAESQGTGGVGPEERRDIVYTDAGLPVELDRNEASEVDGSELETPGSGEELKEGGRSSLEGETASVKSVDHCVGVLSAEGERNAHEPPLESENAEGVLGEKDDANEVRVSNADLHGDAETCADGTEERSGSPNSEEGRRRDTGMAEDSNGIEGPPIASGVEEQTGIQVLPRERPGMESELEVGGAGSMERMAEMGQQGSKVERESADQKIGAQETGWRDEEALQKEQETFLNQSAGLRPPLRLVMEESPVERVDQGLSSVERFNQGLDTSLEQVPEDVPQKRLFASEVSPPSAEPVARSLDLNEQAVDDVSGGGVSMPKPVLDLNQEPPEVGADLPTDWRTAGGLDLAGAAQGGLNAKSEGAMHSAESAPFGAAEQTRAQSTGPDLEAGLAGAYVDAEVTSPGDQEAGFRRWVESKTRMREETETENWAGPTMLEAVGRGASEVGKRRATREEGGEVAGSREGPRVQQTSALAEVEELAEAATGPQRFEGAAVDTKSEGQTVEAPDEGAIEGGLEKRGEFEGRGASEGAERKGAVKTKRQREGEEPQEVGADKGEGIHQGEKRKAGEALEGEVSKKLKTEAGERASNELEGEGHNTAETEAGVRDLEEVKEENEAGTGGTAQSVEVEVEGDKSSPTSESEVRSGGKKTKARGPLKGTALARAVKAQKAAEKRAALGAEPQGGEKEQVLEKKGGGKKKGGSNTAPARAALAAKLLRQAQQRAAAKEKARTPGGTTDDDVSIADTGDDVSIADPGVPPSPPVEYDTPEEEPEVLLEGPGGSKEGPVELPRAEKAVWQQTHLKIDTGEEGGSREASPAGGPRTARKGGSRPQPGGVMALCKEVVLNLSAHRAGHLFKDIDYTVRRARFVRFSQYPLTARK